MTNGNHCNAFQIPLVLQELSTSLREGEARALHCSLGLDAWQHSSSFNVPRIKEPAVQVHLRFDVSVGIHRQLFERRKHVS